MRIHELDAVHLGELVLDETPLTVFTLDEEGFKAFYERTSRMVWAYIVRLTGDRQVADDLLQDAYYRLLRSGVVFEGEDHRRRYLFRIATNLVRDRHRQERKSAMVVTDTSLLDQASEVSLTTGHNEAERMDLQTAFAQMKPRDREMLWLAYAQGRNHREIAETLGLRAASIKVLLFRARRRLADLLGRTGREGGGQ